MEVLLDVVTSVLKADFPSKAAAMFPEIRQKAANGFGWIDEVTIWAGIYIGIIYQRYRSWKSAIPWFECAWAASFVANGAEDGITRSLQTVIEKRHFSERLISVATLFLRFG